MEKLSQVAKNIIEKWKETSKGKKIAFATLIVGVIGALIYLAVFLGTTKYDVLFAKLDSNDSKAVMAKLDEKKIQYKASGGSILVPTGEVDKLRLELAPDLTNGSKGWELLENSKFAPTDKEMDITFQRALEGELERTIKSFSEVENARVHLVQPENSVFVKDSTPAKASVTLKIKQPSKLNEDQVRAIIALVSGSVKNLPKENVEVVDDGMRLLSKNVFAKDKAGDIATSTEKQQEIKRNFEKSLEVDLLSMLESAFGKEKVKVKVNAELNFDAVEKTSTIFDPKNVVRSEHSIKDGNSATAARPSQSPVDNNMNNTVSNTPQTGNNTHEEVTKNYEIPKTEEKTTKAPGEVKRLTTSVVVDSKKGPLDEATKTSIQNLVQNAIGFDTKRGDSISVEGFAFDTTGSDTVKKDLDAMKLAENAKKMLLYRNIGIGVGSALLLLLIFFIIRRKKKMKEEEPEGILDGVGGLDVVIGDDIQPKEEVHFEPIDFEQNNEKSHFEKEIKSYATSKPEQVADIIKSWLAEDER